MFRHEGPCQSDVQGQNQTCVGLAPAKVFTRTTTTVVVTRQPPWPTSSLTCRCTTILATSTPFICLTVERQSILSSNRTVAGVFCGWTKAPPTSCYALHCLQENSFITTHCWKPVYLCVGLSICHLAWMCLDWTELACAWKNTWHSKLHVITTFRQALLCALVCLGLAWIFRC